MKYSKYRSKPTFADGIRFHSQKEARRYKDLRMLERVKIIEFLEIQRPFFLCVNSQNVGKYVADFTYFEDGKFIVEDVKGVRTPLYIWKRRHFEIQYGVKIRET